MKGGGKEMEGGGRLGVRRGGERGNEDGIHLHHTKGKGD